MKENTQISYIRRSLKQTNAWISFNRRLFNQENVRISHIRRLLKHENGGISEICRLFNYGVDHIFNGLRFLLTFCYPLYGELSPLGWSSAIYNATPCSEGNFNYHLLQKW